MSMVWPCPLTVDVYASLGRAVKVPRPQCPSCSRPVVFWSGYWRHVRWQEREGKIFVPRVRCAGCGVTHALLPAFALARRLDAAESAGAVISQVAAGASGVRPAAGRRFRWAAGAIGAAFTAAAALPGWAALGAWRFASAVTGGSLLAANASSPWLVIGSRRFMPPRSP